jgi:hypothetical protein
MLATGELVALRMAETLRTSDPLALDVPERNAPTPRTSAPTPEEVAERVALAARISEPVAALVASNSLARM